MSRLVLFSCVAAVVLSACGCGTGSAGGALRPESPQPVLALVGQSHAFAAADWSSLPAGPGAEGRPGDLVLQNGFVRFVVAADDHGGLVRIAGNVIDAAVQGGEDRMRLLAALIGDGPVRRPLYSAVRIDNPGGVGVPAVVVAEGRMSDRPGIAVTTSYTLEPDSRFLDIATGVRNDTGGMVSLLSAGDALYPGRTLRFVPDAGLMPTGRRSSSTWLAFFSGDLCWGLLAPSPGMMEGVHEAGRSELRYARLDVAPGETRTYSRRLMAAAGGPARVWQAAYPIPDAKRSRLVVSLKDRETEEPVPDGQVIVAPQEGGSPVLMITDRRGEAALDLPAGTYSIVAWAPGRPAEGPLTLDCGAACVHVQPITLAPAARVEAKARMRVGAFVVPAAVRVAAYPAAKPDSPFPPVTPFPMEGWSGAAYTGIGGVADLPLMPPGATSLGSALVVASRGPLFRCDGDQVETICGRTAETSLTVERVVDPGHYVSVDCRQHCQDCIDCAVSAAERAAANACEGLTAAVLSGPVWRPAQPGPRADDQPGLIRGLRVRIDGLGSFSAFPLDPETDSAPDLRRLAGATDAWNCVEMLREAFPNAVIQADDPMDRRAGHFALSGFDPLKQRTVPFEVNAPFDAVEMVCDHGTEGVDETLAYWFALLNTGRRVALTGSSGARDLEGASGGAMRTFLYCPSRDPVPTHDELEKALRALRSAPNAVVSNGPFVEVTLNGQPVGSVVTAEAHSVRMELRVYAPPWVDVGTASVYRDGEVVKTFPLEKGQTALRLERQIDLDAQRDCWFAVRVSGTRPLPSLYCMGPDGPPAFAMTNPFWVDADGNGEVNVVAP